MQKDNKFLVCLFIFYPKQQCFGAWSKSQPVEMMKNSAYGNNEIAPVETVFHMCTLKLQTPCQSANKNAYLFYYKTPQWIHGLNYPYYYGYIKFLNESGTELNQQINLIIKKVPDAEVYQGRLTVAFHLLCFSRFFLQLLT